LIRILISDITFYVMLIEILFLFYLRDINDLGVSFDNITNELVIRKGDMLNVLVFRRFGYIFIFWDICL
jgi:hypothetical protein